MKQVEDKRGAVDTNQFQVGTRTKASMDKAWKALKDRATIYQKDPNGPAPTPRKTPRKPGKSTGLSRWHGATLTNCLALGEEPAKPAKKRTKTYKPNNFKNDNRRDDHDDNRGGPNSGIEAN